MGQTECGVGWGQTGWGWDGVETDRMGMGRGGDRPDGDGTGWGQTHGYWVGMEVLFVHVSLSNRNTGST